jgi:glutathione-specific gamma-glutamylcyclotransferase
MDPFTHLPGLRERLIPAHESGVRITPEILAMFDERARTMGRPAGWRLSEEEREASRRDVIGHLREGEDLWVYGYGSLMWDPGFHFSEVRVGDLDGYQRRFTFRTTLGRGSLERPGLMLALEPGAGSCRGLAFRIAADVVEAESTILWRREMMRGVYSPAMHPVATPQGPVTALAFASNPHHAEYVGELSLADTAAFIARAAGPLGTNRGYLEQLVAQLAALAIEDDYVARLLAHLPAACEE